MDPVEQVRTWLNDIPPLTAELIHYRTPGSAPPDPDARHATGGTAPIPINADAFDLLDTRDKGHQPDDPIALATGRLGTLPWLGAWVSLVHAELEDTGQDLPICCPNRQHTIEGEVTWLHTHAAEILHLHPDERDNEGRILICGFAHHLEQLWKALRHACRIQDPYQPRCPTCGWTVAAVYTDNDQLLAYWQCTGCPKTWQHLAEIQRLALTQPPMTLRQISTFLDIPLRQLYKWRDDRRYLPVNTTGGRNGTLYEVDHIRRAAQRDDKAKRVV